METLCFRLYISTRSGQADDALANLKALCAVNGYECDVELIDIFTDPERAELDRIIATPTLLKLGPPPQRRIIGDLSDRQSAFVALGLGGVGDVE